MKSISYKIERVKIISEKFNEIRKELITNQELITDILKNLIGKYADEFSLSKSTSIKKLNLYSIVYRVKEIDSFSEKLVRNNDYNLFDDNLKDLGKIDQPTLKTKIKELDDLIGIKILTDLNVDSINMFKLVSSTKFLKELADKGIVINSEDLNKQPVPMKNGLPIFKLRCKYETWNFELQIKSKLESAWGDMEHSIFYKDYKLTPVRDVAQQSMNHIGKLLIEIDDFLNEIREANNNFSLNSNAILFSNEFEDKYSSKVAELLDGIRYNFKKIASLSYNINSIGFDILKGKNLNVNHLSLTCEKYASYITLRNSDFDLQIFETILFSNFDKEMSEKNLEEALDNQFKLIKESYKASLLINKIIQDDELANNFVELFFETCIKNCCKGFLINTKDVNQYFENLKLLNEGIEVLELAPDEINELLSSYTIFCFEGDFENFLKSLDKDRLLENLESAKGELIKIKVVENDIFNNLNSLINILS